MILKLSALLISSLIIINSEAQSDYIFTKDGEVAFNRRELIFNCLQSLHKDRSDHVAMTICECQADKINGHFSLTQYRKHSSKKSIDLPNLIKEDSLLERQIQECFTASGKTFLISAEGFSDKFISACIANIQKNTNKNLDSTRLLNFCTCQLELIKTKKMTDEDYRQLGNPNSLLFYEIIYKCGNPFADKNEIGNEWNELSEKDVRGPQSDTINVLTLGGMTLVKIKIGSVGQVWLFDTGATDLLINKEMESVLRKESIISDDNFKGTGQYEMANGIIDTCRKYIINNVHIGKFSIDNILVAVSDKSKKIIAGKVLMNKFSSWILNNKNNTLILNK